MRKRKSSVLPFEQRGAASVSETADYLGVGRNTVYSFIKAGKLKVAKLGSRTCVLTASARALLQQDAA
jgi:excisionase family DNA binding protein